MASESQLAFIRQYAAYAMNEQIKYGIPASITLAQMALESGWGEKSLGNNCFGIKAYGSWEGRSVRNPKDGLMYRDYDSVEQGIEDHSKVLNLKNYDYCRQFSSTDYRNWAIGLQHCNYATVGNYASSLIDIIKNNGFDMYDRKALEIAGQYNIEPGKGDGIQGLSSSRIYVLNNLEGRWCLPLNDISKYRITTLFNQVDSLHPNGHKGLDISTNHKNVPLLATEDKGKVLNAGSSPSAGNNVTIQYERQDGSKYRVTYMHLKEMYVKKDDTVNAGQQIGLSGTTGHSTGEHLHLEVAYYNKETGKYERCDPLQYLAEIETRGNIAASLSKDGKDLLAYYRNGMVINGGQQLPSQDLQGIDNNLLALSQLGYSNDPTKWLGYFQNGTEGQSGSILTDIVSTLFEGVITVAMMLDSHKYLEDTTDEQAAQRQEAEDKAKNTTVDESIVHRSRDEVDTRQLHADLALAYDEQLPEQEQQQQRDYRLA